MKAVNTRIGSIEKRYEAYRKVTDAKIEKPDDAIKNLTEIVMKQGDELKNLKNKQFNERVMAEYHSRKYNLVIHNLPENGSDAWETNVDSINKVKTFFGEMVGISNSRSIPLQNAHRMGNRKAKTKTVTNGYDKERTETWYGRPMIVRFSHRPDL